MTPNESMDAEERRIRFQVGSEIIEAAILDYLRANCDTQFNTYELSVKIGFFSDSTLGFFLNRLRNKGKIDNHRTGKWNRWQAKCCAES